MASQVRITGLIRTANWARRELAAVTDPHRRELIRQRIERDLAQVRQLLSRYGASVEQLPAPSRRAFRFLEHLDFADTSAASATPSSPRSADSLGALRGSPDAGTLDAFASSKIVRPKSVSWRGLGTMIDRAVMELAYDVSDAQLVWIAQSLGRASRQIELAVARDPSIGQHLTRAAREQRGWLAFFSRLENLTAYAQARQRASAILDRAAAGSRSFPPPLKILFLPIGGIYKMRPSPRGTVLRLPAAMIAFDEIAFSELATLIFGRDADSRRRILTHMVGEGVQSIRAELEALGGNREQSRGTAYDLGESFDRVNAAYFGGKMPRPKLTWNATFTGRKFGHYDWIADTVMVSRTLDSPRVPPFVVDYLMFHELLHKFHGLHWSNGRGYAHTAEFYRDERKFAQYSEAEAVLQQLARG